MDVPPIKWRFDLLRHRHVVSSFTLTAGGGVPCAEHDRTGFVTSVIGGRGAAVGHTSGRVLARFMAPGWQFSTLNDTAQSGLTAADAVERLNLSAVDVDLDIKFWRSIHEAIQNKPVAWGPTMSQYAKGPRGRGDLWDPRPATNQMLARHRRGGA